MNRLKINSYIFLLIFLNISISNVTAQSVFDKVNKLLQSNNYQELNRIYPHIKDSIADDFSKNVIEGCLHNGMNRYGEAFKCYDYLINKYSNMYDMTNFLGIAIDNLINMGLYKDAKQYIEKFYYKDTLQQDVKIPFPKDFPLVRSYTIAYALQECKPSKIIRNTDKTTISEITIDKNGYWFIQGNINGISENFMIDTGASENIISENFAHKHNIWISPDSVQIQGITGTGYAKIGFIDSITIGNLSYQNVMVSILPNLIPAMREHLNIKVDAILGFPFIHKVGIIEILPKKKKIVFPTKYLSSKPDNQSNISLWSNHINIEMSIGPVEKNIFILDTGSMGGIDLPYQLFEIYKDKLERYKFKEKRIGMVDMFEKVDTTFAWRARKKVPINIGCNKIKTKSVGSIKDRNIPLIGVTVLNEFRKITIDLDAMKITVE